jgi:hypothetical protein
MIRSSEASQEAAAVTADSIVVKRDDGLFQIGLRDDTADPPPSLMAPEPTVRDEITGLSRPHGAAMTQALRHQCRNPRCRSKLSAPVSNPREAFCARGCHSSFYRKRCVACEQPMERKRESQQLCGRRKCEGQFKTLKAHMILGRYHPSTPTENAGPVNHPDAAVDACGKPIKTGTFLRLKTDRAWRQVAGPEQSDRQLRLATADANAVERSNRMTNRQHWRAAGTAALIQRDTMPVNIVGGYKFPNAPRIELTVGDPQSAQNPTLAIADGDDLPAFLDRRRTTQR